MARDVLAELLMIRPAVLDDIPALTEMGVAFCEALEQPHSLESIEQTLRDLIESGVLLTTDDRSAMVGGVVVPIFFDRERKLLTELFWFVKPESRGKNTGRALLSAFEDMGVKLGVSHISMMAILDSDRIGKFYEDAGYRKYETAYLKEV